MCLSSLITPLTALMPHRLRMDSSLNSSAFAENGCAEGLWALGAAEAQRALSAIACVVGLLVQWASQGQHWAHMARDLLQVRGSITIIVVCLSVSTSWPENARLHTALMFASPRSFTDCRRGPARWWVV